MWAVENSVISYVCCALDGLFWTVLYIFHKNFDEEISNVLRIFFSQKKHTKLLKINVISHCGIRESLRIALLCLTTRFENRSNKKWAWLRRKNATK